MYVFTYIAAVPEYFETVITTGVHSNKPTDFVFLGPAILCDTTVAKTESQWSLRSPV